MKTVLLFALLALVSCGKKDSSDNNPRPVSTVVKFVGDATNDPRLQNVEIELDFSLLNQEIPAEVLLGPSVCNLAYGNSNAVQDTGVTEGHVIVESSDKGASGKIRFSHLAYFDPAGNDELCRLFSKESFDFTYDGTTLTIYAIAPGKSWDGAQNSFTRL